MKFEENRWPKKLNSKGAKQKKSFVSEFCIVLMTFIGEKFYHLLVSRLKLVYLSFHYNYGENRCGMLQTGIR